MLLASSLNGPSPGILLAAMQRLPMSGDAIAISAPEGSTVAEFIELGFPATHRPYVVAELDGVEIDAEAWAKTRPVAGQALTLVFRPAGKNFVRTILSIAVVAVGLWVSGGALAGVLGSGFAAGTVGASLAAAGVSIVGNLLINALVPIGAPSRGTQEAPPPFYSITGARNASPAWGKAPILFGRHRIVPPLAGQVIRETVGDETYLRIPLLLGMTPMAALPWKAGETLLSDLPGVEIEERLLETDPPHTLYTGDPSQAAVDVVLSDTSTQRTTAANVDEIEVGISFKSGLGAYNSKQQKVAANVTLEIVYRQTGTSGAWISLRPSVPQANDAAEIAGNRYRPALIGGGLMLNYAMALATIPDVPTFGSGDLSFTRSDPGRGFSRAIRFAVPRGQYDVRVRRTTAPSTDPNTTDGVWWDTLNSIAAGVDPFPNRKLATAVIRIKSGPETNGVIEQLNCVGHSMAPGFDAGALATPATATAASLTAPTQTRNPALLALMCLRGHHNAQPVPDDEIDWPSFADAAVRMAPYTFDEYVQTNISRHEMANRILAAGFGKLTRINGRRAIIIDRSRAGEPPAQVFNTRNVSNFRWRKTFAKEVHGVRVGFANEDNGWNADEVIVYMPGYNAANATIFETLPVPGGTNPDQIRTVINQYLRNAFYQTEAFEFEQDIESLTASKGAYVLVRHDVILVGKGDAKVIELHMSGGNVTGFTLDFGIETEAGPSLGARWRKVRSAGGVGRIEVDGEVVVTRTLDNARRFNFTAPRAPSAAPAVGDLVSIGETGQVAYEALVQSIRPMPGFRAGITLIAYAGERFAPPGVWPAHNPMTTVPFGARPATPELLGASAGSREIAVGFKMPASPKGITLTGFDIAVRQHGATDDTWTPCGVLQAEERLAVAPPGDPGTAYDVRIIAMGYDSGGIAVYSMPLVVSEIAAESDAFAPVSVNASFVVRTSTAGSQQPVLVATWTPNEDPDVIDTYVEMLASTGPNVWRALGSAPAISGAFEMHGLQVDRSYTLRFYNVTRRGAVSTRVQRTGIVAPDSMVAAFAGVASSIIGQGWGATASEAAARATRGQGLLKNSLFQIPFTGSAIAPEWYDWYDGIGTFITKPFGDGYCLQMDGPAGASRGIAQLTNGVTPGTSYMLCAEVRRNGGTFAGAGVYVEFWNGGTFLQSTTVSFATAETTAGIVNAAPDGVHRWERVVTAPASTTLARVYAMSHWAGYGSIAAANSIAWLEADLIPMSLVRQLRADITSGNTAAAIAGQGDLATTNRAALGFGVNGLIDSDFIRGRALWGPGWDGNTGLTVTRGHNLGGWSGIRNVPYSVVSGTPAPGTVWDSIISANTEAEVLQRGLRVYPGDRLYARWLAAHHRCNHQTLVKFHNQAGTFIGEATTGGNGTEGGASNGDPANFTLSEGYVTVPAGASFATLCARGVGKGEATPYMFSTEPMLMRVPAGQTALGIPYTPGRPDPLGDRTSDNTAGAIAGQGIFATANYYEQSSDPGGVANGSIWFNTSTNNLYIRRSGAWGYVANIAGGGAPQLWVAQTPEGGIEGVTYGGYETVYVSGGVSRGGGTGGYSHAWLRTGGNAYICANPGNSQSIAGSIYVPAGGYYFEDWLHTLTDSAGTKVTCPVNVRALAV